MAQSKQGRQLRIAKHQARVAFRNAVKMGILIKPNSCSVEGCIETNRIDAHHYKGYSREHWLDVMWLCKKHHSQAHNQQRRGVENPVFDVFPAPPKFSIKKDVRNADRIKKHLQCLYMTFGMTWREIANLPEFQGIPAGTLCSISKGYDVKNPSVRVKLGLPARALAPVCVSCGVVHVSRKCPARKSLPNWRDLPVKTLAWCILNREPMPK
jgi:hypothetical protein